MLGTSNQSVPVAWPLTMRNPIQIFMPRCKINKKGYDVRCDVSFALINGHATGTD